MANLDYNPTKTLNRFHMSDKLARFVVGPLGSGKSFAMIMELLRRATEQAPDHSGIRPTKFAIIRNVMDQLRKTCLADVRALFDEAGILTYKVYEHTVYVEYPLEDDTIVKSEWQLTPIDSVEDTRKLLSLQLTGAWASEFRELDYRIIAAVLGRVGRYPPKARVKPTWEGLIAESNPFSEGSDWFENLALNLPKDWDYFKQPGGLSAGAENRSNLPTRYYERLVEGNGEEWVKVHVHGEYGDDLSGQAIFGRAFSRADNLMEDLVVNPQLPLMLAQDLGRTPTTLICQVDTRGRLLVFEEVLSEDMGLHQYITEKLTPLLHQERYSTTSRFVVMDPAGMTKSQLREETARDAFMNHGYSCHPATTNNVDARLRAVESLLLQNRGDTRALLIDPAYCPMLVRAMQHDYKYRRKKTGDLEETPSKTHPASDLADCLQYACLAVASDLPGRHAQSRTPRHQPVRISAAAWT
jgi:hypothetical protein